MDRVSDKSGNFQLQGYFENRDDPRRISPEFRMGKQMVTNKDRKCFIAAQRQG